MGAQVQDDLGDAVPQAASGRKARRRLLPHVLRNPSLFDASPGVQSNDMTQLKPGFPAQGWRQLLTGKKQMLGDLDRARDQSASHEIETFHGRVAEAAFRKWLEGFLPKRYGVTSGYVISQGLGTDDKLPHFDVVIFDRLLSPVLWIEDNPDSSEQGVSRAIPAEHVLAVLEVKTSLSKRAASQAVEHLFDLSRLMQGMDVPGERYPTYLPAAFSCGCVFFELRSADAFSGAIDALIGGARLRRFWGGVVLRGDGLAAEDTGRISFVQSEKRITAMSLEKGTPPSFWMSGSQEVDGDHVAANLVWSSSGFAEFAFDLIALMNGTFQVGRLSSFHGLGGPMQPGSSKT